jgi:K+/H+ antiporter YhaU regulatory subunit KhtT
MSPKLLEKIQSPAESFEYKAPSPEQVQQQYNLMKVAAEKIAALPPEASDQDKTNIVLETIFGLNPTKVFGGKPTALKSFAKKVGLAKKSNADLIQAEELPIKLDTLKQIDEYLKANKILNNIDAAADVPLFVGLGMVGLPLIAAVPVGVALSEGLYNYAFQPIQNRDIMEVKRRDQPASKTNNIAHWIVRGAAIGATAVGASIAIPAMFAPTPMVMDAHLEQLKDGPTKLNKAVTDRETSVFEQQNKSYKEKKLRLDALTQGREEAKATIKLLEAKPNLTADEKKTLTNVKGRFLNAKFGGAAEIAKLTKELDALDKQIPEIQAAKGFRKQSESVLGNFNNAIQLPANRNVLEAVVDDIGKWDAISNWTNLDKSIGFGDKLQLALKETQKNPFGFYLATGIAALISAAGLTMGKALKNNGEFAMSRQVEYRDELAKTQKNIMELLHQFVQNEMTMALANENPVEVMKLKMVLVKNGATIGELDAFDNRAKSSVAEAKAIQSLVSSGAYNNAVKIANGYRQGLVGTGLSEVDSAFMSQKDANNSKENKEIEKGNKLQLDLQTAFRSAKAKNSTDAVIKELETTMHKFANVKNENSKFSVGTSLQQLKNIRKPKNPDLVESHLDGLVGITNVIKKLNETKMTEPVKLQVAKFLLQHQIDNPDLKISYGQIKELVGNSGVLSDNELANFESNINERRFDQKEKLAVDQMVVELSKFEKNNFALPPMNKGPNGIIKGYISKFSDAITKTLNEINKLESVKASDNINPKILQLQQNLKALSNLRPSNTDPEKIKTELQDKLNKIITVYQS